MVRIHHTHYSDIRKTDTLLDVCFSWWERVDSNHRRRCQQIYSLPPLATREHSHIYIYSLVNKNGAGGRTRTPDLLITNQLLYQLSYTSVSTLEYYTINDFGCQYFFSKNRKKFQRQNPVAVRMALRRGISGFFGVFLRKVTGL